MEIFIHVRWQWLILHVALFVTSSIFLFMVIQMSYREHAPVWKSSSLAMLFHRLDERERGMMKVALRDGEAGYRLV